MKKILSILMIGMLALSLVACAPSENSEGGTPTENIEGTLEEILAKIYETADVEEEQREYFQNNLATTAFTPDAAEYYLGVNGLDFAEAIASEPLMSSQAYSLCLVRANEGADIDQMMTDIKENVNPNKWICVGVEEDQVIVDHIGDLVILIMSDQAEALHQAFLNLQ